LSASRRCFSERGSPRLWSFLQRGSPRPPEARHTGELGTHP